MTYTAPQKHKCPILVKSPVFTGLEAYFLGTTVEVCIGSTRYFRGGPKSRASRVSIEIPVKVSRVKKVLVTHHVPAQENQ